MYQISGLNIFNFFLSPSDEKERCFILFLLMLPYLPVVCVCVYHANSHAALILPHIGFTFTCNTPEAVYIRVVYASSIRYSTY